MTESSSSQRPQLEDFDPSKWEGDSDQLPLGLEDDPDLCNEAFMNKHEAFGAGLKIAWEHPLTVSRGELGRLLEQRDDLDGDWELLVPHDALEKLCPHCVRKLLFGKEPA